MKSLRRLLGALLAACVLTGGCSKPGTPEAAPPKVFDLGMVELSPSQPSRHDLGGGAACVFTAKPLDSSSLELIAVLEKSGKRVSSTRAGPINTDRPLELSFGDIRVLLTPHIK
jgi:hypothetical protein